MSCFGVAVEGGASSVGAGWSDSGRSVFCGFPLVTLICLSESGFVVVEAIVFWKREVKPVALLMPGEVVCSAFCAIKRLPIILLSQHFLNFLPDPQGQGSFLPIFSFIMTNKIQDSFAKVHDNPPRFGYDCRDKIIFLFMNILIPVAQPPWTSLGKKMESAFS